MTGRELGCKLTGCLFGGLLIFGFFGGLMSATEGLGRSALAKKQREDAQFDLPILLGGLTTYARSHGERFPTFQNAADLKRTLYPQYVSADDMFTRLGDNVVYQPNLALSGKTIASFKAPETIVTFYEPTSPAVTKRGDTSKPTHAVLFLNGRFVRLDEAEWNTIRAKNHLP